MDKFRFSRCVIVVHIYIISTAVPVFFITLWCFITAPTIPHRDEVDNSCDSQHSLGITLVTADDYASSFRSRMSKTPPWRQDEYLERPTEVFDFLYLGNMDNALDKELLERLGITHIVNCVGRYNLLFAK